MRQARRLLAVTALALAGGTMLMPSAQAIAPPLTANTYSTLSAPEDPPSPAAPLAPSTEGGFSASATADTEIRVQGAVVSSIAKDGSSTVSLTLPKQAGISGAPTQDDGVLVYQSPSITTEILALDDGQVSVRTTLKDASSPRKFTYDLPDGKIPQLLPDGSVDLLETGADGVATTVGHVEEPWAIDAEGDPVPTSYTVTGNTLVQTITPSAATKFPVLADPTWGVTLGISPTAYFNKHETYQLQFAGNYSTICGVVGLVDAPLGVLCGLNIAANTATARRAVKANLCMKMWAPSPVTLFSTTYGGGNCVGRFA